MTYNPNIPNATDNIATSQPQLKTNFQQLKSIFNNDHYTWDFATSASRGFHKQVSFPSNLVADPAIGSFESILYPKADPKDTSARSQLFFENQTASGKVFQITNRFIDSSETGFLMLPNGTDTNKSIIMMWGKVASGAVGDNPVTFPSMANYVGSPIGFPTACFNIQVTPISSNNVSPVQKTITVSSITSQGFTAVLNETMSGGFYWSAIGN